MAVAKGTASHRPRLVAAGVAVLSTLLGARPALAAAGDLDLAFGPDGTGTVTTAFTGGGFASAVAIQPDGKIVAVGAAAGTSGAGEFAVARYGTDGELDASFDGDGVLTTPIAGGGDDAASVAIQPNGRIVVAGTDSARRFAVVRYRADGALDDTFGDGGIVRTNLTGRDDVAFDLALQSDGKIVVVGSVGPGRSFAIVRYRRNGALDRTFGDRGEVLTVRGGVARAVALQADGKIVVTGYSAYGLTVARLLGDGTLDPTFGRNGVVRRVVSEIFPLDVAVQANGRIVVGGDFDIFAFGLARFTSRGRLDRTFSRDGIVRTEVAGGAEQAITGLVIQPDGMIVAAGYVGPHEAGDPVEPSFAVARYQRNGRLDRSWGGDGRVLTTFAGGATARGAAAQADGKIVVVGGAGGGVTPPTFALARYLA